MEEYLKIGESILQEYFDYYRKHSIDDAEYIPVVKVIIQGICKSMTLSNSDKKEIGKVNNQLKDFNRKLYTDLWIKNTKENEGDDIDVDKETESAKYYFDYVYKNEEHPR